MAMVMIHAAPGVTQERNGQVMASLHRHGVTMPAAGQILHLAGPYNGDWRTVDVWESQEATDRFFRDHLSVAFAETGGIPDDPEPQVFPAHDLYT